MADLRKHVREFVGAGDTWPLAGLADRLYGQTRAPQ